MDPNYRNSYRWNSISPITIKENILSKYQNYDIRKQYTFDQLLFIMDEKSISGRCDRDVARELFLQNSSHGGKTSIHDMVFKYVQNLETSKLCLLRDEGKINQLTKKSNNLKGRSKAYVYLKLIQASVYARYSSTPVFSYKIDPTDIPPITLVNSLNPVLNHQYTLQLQQNEFNIIFMESGVPIYTWEWPDQENLKSGQYKRTINAEGVSFDLEIKYMPLQSNQQKDEINKNIKQVEKNIIIQNRAFEKLCGFQPFLDQNKAISRQQKNRSVWWKLTDKIMTCLPFMNSHIRNLYYICIILILVECCASVSWPMQFLDIVLLFAVIGILFDQSKVDIGFPLWIIIFLMLILILKSVWGTITKTKNAPHFPAFLIAAIVLKGITIFMMWFSSVRKQEYPNQRDFFFYSKKESESRSFNQKKDNTQIEFD